MAATELGQPGSPSTDLPGRSGPHEPFIRGVFDSWRRLGIRFVVLRNYEGLPTTFRHDIDVLVERSAMVVAESALLDTARDRGFRLLNRVDMTVAAFLFDHPDGGDIRFDLSWRLDWHGIPFFSEESVLSESRPHGGFRVPSRSQEALIKLLQGLLYGGQVRDRYREEIAAVAREAPLAELSSHYGHTVSAQLLDLAGRGCWEEVEALAPRLRSSLAARRLIRHPLNTGLRLLLDVGRRFRRLRRRTGMTVAFLGPDGAGKSSVIEALQERFSDVYRRQIVLHWKPALVKRGTSSGPVTDPHGKAPRGRLLSTAYFGFHVLEYAIGGFLFILWPTARNHLVVLDRYYHDFYVDRRRFRLNVPDGMVRLGHACIPEPDLVFCLVSPADVLLERKAEVSLEEADRQVEGYRRIASEGHNRHLIQTARPLEEVVDDVEDRLRCFLGERMRGRAGGRR